MSNPLEFVAEYYNQKIRTFGATARGVDWNGEESQRVRFQALAQIINRSDFTINDLGCGYGAFFQYLREQGEQKFRFTFHGADIAEEMINAAKSKYALNKDAHWYLKGADLPKSDFSIASGIFNVRGEISDEVWDAHIQNTLRLLDQKSTLGFAFNMLTKYSDSDKMRPNLRYSDPCFYFDHCKKLYSKNVALLHDYDLYEFTVIVRKN